MTATNEDPHLLSCGCMVFTPPADLLTGGERLARVQRNPDCTVHRPTPEADTYTDGDLDDTA